MQINTHTFRHTHKQRHTWAHKNMCVHCKHTNSERQTDSYHIRTQAHIQSVKYIGTQEKTQTWIYYTYTGTQRRIHKRSRHVLLHVSMCVCAHTCIRTHTGANFPLMLRPAFCYNWVAPCSLLPSNFGALQPALGQAWGVS